MSAPVVTAAVFVPLMASVFGLTASVSPSQDPAGAQEGLSAVFWSALDDCFGGGGGGGGGREDAAMCLKYKALTALDRALGNRSLVVVDGVSLTARAGRSPGPDDRRWAERDDLAVLDTVSDPDRKNALLNDLLASRLDELVSDRTVTVDGEEGRGKKKSKTMKQAIMIASIMAVAVIGPVVLSIITLIAVKALVISKIALVLSSFMAIKKFLSQRQKNSHEIEPVVAHHYARTMKFNSQDMAYSEQKQ